MARKAQVAGVLVDCLSPEQACETIVNAAVGQTSFAATALAVHGAVLGSQDKDLGYRINDLDLVVPDGQPIRWALNLLHRSRLRERVYGPRMMLDVSAELGKLGLSIFLFAPSEESLRRLSKSLPLRFPGLKIAGGRVCEFRNGTAEDVEVLANEIIGSGAALCFVGIGCPRQEIFVFEMRDLVPLPLVAVGAAFDFHAGLAKEPPAWVQRWGFQWLHRLLQDPRRLAKRYVVLNFYYILAISRQLLVGPRPLPGYRSLRVNRFI